MLSYSSWRIRACVPVPVRWLPGGFRKHRLPPLRLAAHLSPRLRTTWQRPQAIVLPAAALPQTHQPTSRCDRRSRSPSPSPCAATLCPRGEPNRACLCLLPPHPQLLSSSYPKCMLFTRVNPRFQHRQPKPTYRHPTTHPTTAPSCLSPSPSRNLSSPAAPLRPVYTGGRRPQAARSVRPASPAVAQGARPPGAAGHSDQLEVWLYALFFLR